MMPNTVPNNPTNGAVNFKRGNLVKNNDVTSLATITQLRPIYVTFSVAEGQLLEIQKAMAAEMAKVALVIWLGGMMTVTFADVMRRLNLVSLICGSVIVVSLFIMKFVGPPPHGFVPRVGLTVLMLILVGLSAFMPGFAPALAGVNLALGFVLLFWYVRE